MVKSWEWRALENMTVTNNLAFTLPFEQSNAWRSRNMLSFIASLSDRFAVKISQTTSYLNVPVPGFGRTDTIVSAALVTKFAGN
jgi:putative salt-induced outer membrane protein YdiY